MAKVYGRGTVKPLTREYLNALKSYGAAKRRGDKTAIDQWRQRIEDLRKDTPHKKDIKKLP